MPLPRSFALTSVALAALLLVGCAASGTDAGPASPADGTSTDQPGGSGDGSGRATVTVDGETWTYDSYLCVVGYEANESDVYSFSSTSFTTTDGEKIQLLIDVLDASGQGRLEGDGVVYEITLYDYGNDSAPTVDIAVEGTDGVSIVDGVITVSGEFIADNDQQTLHTIEAEAVCDYD